MPMTTMADREKELRSLLEKFAAHPEKAFTEERARAAVLRRMFAAQEKEGA